MSKLTLNLDALAVSSFEVDASAENDRGTVNGHGILAASVICATAQASCNYTACANIHQTCGRTCGA